MDGEIDATAAGFATGTGFAFGAAGFFGATGLVAGASTGAGLAFGAVAGLRAFAVFADFPPDFLAAAFFAAAFLAGAFHLASWELVLLVLTTIVSLEAIYLAIFIQMTVNRQGQSLKEVEENVDDIQENVDEIQEDIEELGENVDEMQLLTGGYTAEFGRAAGGVINVITRSGTNQFSGSITGMDRPASIVSALTRSNGGRSLMLGAAACAPGLIRTIVRRTRLPSSHRVLRRAE